jgi:hypothetical protein
MSNEAQMVVEIWDAVRDFVPASKRTDVAELILKAAAEYGFEAAGLADVVEEDSDLEDAYKTVFDLEEDEEDIEEE